MSPPEDTYLIDSKGKSSELLMLAVAVGRVAADTEYRSSYLRSEERAIMKADEPVIVVSGCFQNRQRAYRKIVMYAQRYDTAGRQISCTLDSTRLPPEIGNLDQGQVGEFTLHMNPADGIVLIRIFASTSPILPPWMTIWRLDWQVRVSQFNKTPMTWRLYSQYGDTVTLP